MELCLLLAGELPFRYDDINILKDNREASNPVELNNQHRPIFCLDNSLIGNVLELTRSIDKLLPNLAGKVDYRDEVADTKAKAHRDLEDSADIAT